MLEVILDTETTGLSTTEKHRIVEIGCIELENQIPTNKIFHEYLNPQRTVSEDAYKIHGYSDKFLSNKKIFSEVAESFINFIKDKKIIIHNAAFDLSFLNYEFKLINKKIIDKNNIIDTLEIARRKYPGSQNSLDALCKRFNIDNSKREKHSALIDCQLLREIYINLIDQKEPTLNLKNAEIPDLKLKDNLIKKNNIESFDLILDLQSKIRNSLILKIIPHKKFISSCFNFRLSKPNLNIKKENSCNKVIGIQEIGKYLKGEWNLEKTKEKIYIKTRQYAKRLTTWARGQMLSWQKIHPKDLTSALKKFK